MNSRRRGLRSRMVLSTTLVASIAMAAAIGTMILVVISLTHGRVQTAANDRFDAATAILKQGRSGDIFELSGAADSIQDSVWVFDLGGNQVAGPTAGTHVHAVVVSLSLTTKRQTAHRGEHLYVAGPVKNMDTGKPFAVVVAAESFEPFEATQTAVIIGLITLGLLVVIGTGVLAAWIVGRTLDPVNAMAASAARWSEQDLDQRFEPGPADVEVADLGNTLNVLLDRVATTIRGEQLLTSELAHELRTPLTAIRGEAELGLMKGNGAGTVERLERIVSLVDRMSSTISTLVALARGHAVTGQRANVLAAVAAVAEARRFATENGIDTSQIDPALEVAAPVEMIERSLAPLLDNAIRFAASKIWVTTSVVGRNVAIHVSDDGPGLATGDAEDVFLAGARSSSSAGAGLGLALSRRVARTLGGDITLTSPAQPTTFTLELPAY